MDIQIESGQSFFPQKITLFGETRLEKTNQITSNFNPRVMIKIPFVGIASGELLVWCNLDVTRVRAEERAYAKGILAEASNILAGVALSELADRLDGKIMLAPPKLDENPGTAPKAGTDYRLFMLDGHCDCRIEVVTGEEE